MKVFRAAGLILVCLAFARPAFAQAGVQGDPPVVRLLSAGEGEKRPLRYKLTKGVKETIDLTMDMSISMDVPGVGPQSIDAPPIRMSMDVAVDEVAANGDIVMSMVITAASMEGGPFPTGALDALKGLSAVMTMTDRGLIKAVKFDESKIANPSLAQLLQSSGFDRLSAPLPEEPIGAGARWEVIQRIDANGMSMDQKAIYEVLEIAPGRAMLGVTIEQSAGAQAVNAPAMPPEMQATIVDMKGGGKGRLALNDGSITLYGEMEMFSDITMDMQMGGQTQRMTTSTEVKLTLGQGKKQ